jgi:hypothetical protein
MAVFDFIEGWYNPHRRHSALDYLSRINYEEESPAQDFYRMPNTVYRTGVTPVEKTETTHSFALYHSETSTSFTAAVAAIRAPTWTVHPSNYFPKLKHSPE